VSECPKVKITNDGLIRSGTGYLTAVPIMATMGTAIKHSVPDWVKPSFVIFDIRTLLMLRDDRQSAQMSKITNDGLIRSDTGCFTAVPIMATVGVEGSRMLQYIYKGIVN